MPWQTYVHSHSPLSRGSQVPDNQVPGGWGGTQAVGRSPHKHAVTNDRPDATLLNRTLSVATLARAFILQPGVEALRSLQTELHSKLMYTKTTAT